MTLEIESVKSVERAMIILSSFSQDCTELGITELSKKLNVSKSTIHRLLTSMQKHDFIIQDNVTKRYKPGFMFLHLSEIALKNINIKQASIPILHKLRDITGETIYLNVISNNHRFCIEKAESLQDVRRIIEIGKPLPLYAGASGKVLLAFQSETKIRNILKKAEVKPLNDKVVINPEQIMRALEIIRDKGYCVTSKEVLTEATSISAPIWNYKQRVIASITITGPTYRFTTEKTKEYIELLLKAAKELSRKMGAKSNDSSKLL